MCLLVLPDVVMIGDVLRQKYICPEVQRKTYMSSKIQKESHLSCCTPHMMCLIRQAEYFTACHNGKCSRRQCQFRQVLLPCV